MSSNKKLHPALAALIVVVLVGIVASAAIIINNSGKDETTETQNQSDTGTPPATTNESTDTSSYEDGTYDATGSYISPGGREEIELTVTITNGNITDTSVVTKATDREAREYQELFSNNYKKLIVGKKIGDVSLSRVAGSSLTSNGFNDALDQIKDDAKV